MRSAIVDRRCSLPPVPYMPVCVLTQPRPIASMATILLAANLWVRSRSSMQRSRISAIMGTLNTTASRWLRLIFSVRRKAVSRADQLIKDAWLCVGVTCTFDEMEGCIGPRLV